jgi:hypothetical protein
MDHQAFAQLLGNYGEFVGAIAVVVTLIYLSLQIRSNAKATESQAIVSLSSEMEHLTVAMSTDDALADAMLLAQANEELTPKQQLKLLWWFGGFFRVCESHFIQNQLDATSIDLKTPVANLLRGFASSDEFRRIMEESIASGTASSGFLSWVESEVLAEGQLARQSVRSPWS